MSQIETPADVKERRLSRDYTVKENRGGYVFLGLEGNGYGQQYAVEVYEPNFPGTGPASITYHSTLWDAEGYAGRSYNAIPGKTYLVYDRTTGETVKALLMLCPLSTPDHVRSRRRYDDFGNYGNYAEGGHPKRLDHKPFAVERYLPPPDEGRCSKWTYPTQEVAEMEARRMYEREPNRAFMVYDRRTGETVFELKALPLLTKEQRRAWRDKRTHNHLTGVQILCTYMAEIIPVLDAQAETAEGAQGILNEADMESGDVSHAVFKVAQVRAMARLNIDHPELWEDS